MARIPELALVPIDRLPILHRDRVAQRAYADSSPVQQSPRFAETGLRELKTPRQQFHWQHSSRPAMCRRSRPRDAPDSTPESPHSAEWKIPTLTPWKNPEAATSSEPDPARSRRIESGNTCSNNLIAPAWIR